MKRVRVLVVDDEPGIRAFLGDLLTAQGIEPVFAESGTAALEKFQALRPAVVLLDLKMSGLGGMDLLPELKAIDPRVSAIVFTAHGDIPSAVEAMRRGAYDYLTKPSPVETIALCVRRALERSELLAEVEVLKRRIGKAAIALERKMGQSEPVHRVIEQVDRVAATNFTVFVQGETGTGKELVGRAIHAGSARRNEPFIALDCGAIVETLIESELLGYERGAFTGADRRKDGHFRLAQGGTLFLDQIVNLPLTTQAKLLRALQERQIQPLGSQRPTPIDVRIIAASNVPLDAEMKAGRFRQDLFYRLSEFSIVLPPLRERRDDIVVLTKRFIDEVAMELRRPVRGVSDAAADLLLRHAWPGNVRELRNVIRQAVLRGQGVILPEHLNIGAGNLCAGGEPRSEPRPRGRRRELGGTTDQDVLA